MAKTLQLFDVERNSLSSQKKDIPYSLVTWWVEQSSIFLLLGGFPTIINNFISFVFTIISFHFLIPLLFPVNCYLTLSFSVLCLLWHPLDKEGEWCVVFLVGVLIWRIPFLNNNKRFNTNYSGYCSGWSLHIMPLATSSYSTLSSKSFDL